MTEPAGDPGVGVGGGTGRGAAFGLRLFFWGFVVKEIFSLLAMTLFYFLPQLVSYGARADGWDITDWFRLIATVSAGIQIVGLAVCFAGLWFVVRDSDDRIGQFSLVAYGVSLGLSVVDLLLRLAGVDLPRWVGEAVWIVAPALEWTALSLLVVMLERTARAKGRAASGLAVPIYVVCGLSFLVPRIRQLMWLLDVDRVDFAVLYGVVNIGPGVLGLVLLVMVIFFLLDAQQVLAASGGAVSGAGQDAPVLGQAPWPSVRGGVAAYRAGLIARIWIMLVGMGLLMLAVAGRSAELARGLLIVMSLGGLVTTGWMLFGLFGYAQVPQASGGRGAAVFALVVGGLATLLDLYAMVLAFQMLSDRYSVIRDAMEISPWIEGSAQVLGLLGAMGLLFSFSRVGRHVGAPEVSRRVGAVAVLLGLTAAGALVLRILAVTRAIRGMGMIPLALGVLILAIVTLVMFLGVLKQFRRAIGAFGDARAFD